MRYAIVNSGKVENIAIADGALGANWIEIGDQSIGTGWGYADGIFTAPTIETSPPIHTLTKLEYMNRFTDAELAGIYTAAKSFVAIEVWLAKFNAVKDDIDLDDPRTVAGVQGLESAGLLAAGRAAEILE